MAKIKVPLSEDYLSMPYTSFEEPLSRLQLADQLTSLYGNLDHGTVAILNGRWGSGKSTFSRKLTHHLKAAGISVTYFDAFAKDFSDSPFMALSTHIVDEIDRNGNTNLPSAKAIKSSSKKVSKKVASVSAKVAIKALTLGIIGSSEIDALADAASDISDASSELAEEAVDSIFDDYLKSESEFEEFRASLNGLAAALGGVDGEGEPTKTVFIIDELDRCRPDFALGILEVIKHLFGNDNVHFLLVTNIDYLVASVNAKYGLEEESAEYLEKFYDFIVFFEQKPWDSFRHGAATLVGQRLSAILDGREGREVHDLVESLQAFAKAFDLSLRQASALATNAALAFLSVKDGSFRQATLMAVLALYRAKFPEIYQDIKKGTYTKEQVTSVFAGVEFDDQFHSDKLVAILEFYAAKDGEIDRNDDRYFGFSSMTARYDYRSYRDVLPSLANSVMDNFGQP